MSECVWGSPHPRACVCLPFPLFPFVALPYTLCRVRFFSFDRTFASFSCTVITLLQLFSLLVATSPSVFALWLLFIFSLSRTHRIVCEWLTIVFSPFLCRFLCCGV